MITLTRRLNRGADQSARVYRREQIKPQRNIISPFQRSVERVSSLNSHRLLRTTALSGTVGQRIFRVTILAMIIENPPHLARTLNNYLSEVANTVVR